MNYLEKLDRYSKEFNPQIVSDVRKEFEKKGKDGYWQKLISIDWKTEDVLQRAKLWCFKRIFESVKSGYLLDVGCGVAEDSFRFANNGFDVVGIDRSPEKITFCRDLIDTYKVNNVKFMEMDALAPAFFAKWFDVAYSSMVIEHLISPFDGLRQKARVARYICGIIHMGEKKEDNPYHTHFLTEDDVAYYLKGLIYPEYKFEIIDKYVFIVFFGKVKIIENAWSRISSFGMKLAEDLNLNDSRWLITDEYCTDVDVDAIMSEFEPLGRVSTDVVDNYMSAIETHGKIAVERSFRPIRLVKFPDDVYRVWGDGNHRVYALKKSGLLKKARMYVLELKHE